MKEFHYNKTSFQLKGILYALKNNFVEITITIALSKWLFKTG